MIKTILRVGLAFPAAAAAVTATTMLPFLAWDAVEKIHGWRAVRNVLRDEAAMLGFSYLWALKLVALFGLPAWLILRWRRWDSALAYAVAGAIAADVGLAVLCAVMQPPADAWWSVAALWIAGSGAAGGLGFRAVASPRAD